MSLKNGLSIGFFLFSLPTLAGDMKYVCNAYTLVGDRAYPVISYGNTRGDAIAGLIKRAKAQVSSGTLLAYQMPVIQSGDNRVYATVVNACAENL